MEVWHVPNRTYFGSGALGSLAEVLAEYEITTVMLVVDELATHDGATDRVQKLLQPAGVMAYTHTLRSPRVEQDDAAELSEAARAHRAEAFVALGTSAAIGTAKLARFGGEGNARSTARLFAVPLTAEDGSASGRELRFRGAEDTATTTLAHDVLQPDAAFIDVDLLEGRQSEDLASDAFSVLATHIEGYLAQGSHPIANALALRGIRLLVRSVPIAVEDNEDQADEVLGAVQDLQMAAILSAVSEQKGRGPAAALAYAISHERGVPYGIAQGIVLPAVIDFHRTVRLERIAKVGKIFGAKGSDEETLAFECSGALRALRSKLGMPASLASIDVAESDFEAIAAHALADETALDASPRECGQDDMLALLRASA